MSYKPAYSERIQNLLDQHKPLTEHEELLLLGHPGMGPLEPEPIKRQPYDSLYLKLKYDRDLWRRS